MDKAKNLAKIAYYNTKTLPKSILLFGVIYIIGITLLIHVFKALNFPPVYIGEYLLILLGILLFTHLAIFEKEGNVYELTYLKDMPHYLIVALRTITYMVFMYILIVAMLCIEKAFGAEFNLLKCINGSFITAFYLGVIGMVIAYISGQKTVGYIVPFVYYMLDMFTYGKYTKGFYLFSLLNDDFTIKINLLITSGVVLGGFFVYLYKKL